MISAQQQLTSLKARFLAGQVSQPEVDAATTAVTRRPQPLRQRKRNITRPNSMPRNSIFVGNGNSLSSAARTSLTSLARRRSSPNSSRATKRRTEKTLGAKFNIRAFHDAVLELGSVPLPVVTERIDRFIAEGGKGPYPDME